MEDMGKEIKLSVGLSKDMRKQNKEQIETRSSNLERETKENNGATSSILERGRRANGVSDKETTN